MWLMLLMMAFLLAVGADAYSMQAAVSEACALIAENTLLFNAAVGLLALALTLSMSTFYLYSALCAKTSAPPASGGAVAMLETAAAAAAAAAAVGPVPATEAEAVPRTMVDAAARLRVSGVSAALPTSSSTAAGSASTTTTTTTDGALARLLRGENFLTPVCPPVVRAMLEKNVVQLKKDKATGEVTKHPVADAESAIKLAGVLGPIDLQRYGVSASIAATMDRAVQVAVAAGLEAVKDAGMVPGDSANGEAWVLPQDMQESTGVVYATSFPALDAAIGEVMRFLESKSLTAASARQLAGAFRQRILDIHGAMTADDEQQLAHLARLAEQRQERKEEEDEGQGGEEKANYTFDRKFLFRLLCLGNSQLAQVIKARGPNMQTNAACAGTTQAIALAQDMLRLGRAQRMVVIAGDNASSETLMPWLGNGFRALGAASIAPTVETAALPFDKRRNGMLLGAGAIGLVLETETAALSRLPAVQVAPACFLVETLCSNSAFHGAALDRHHIAAELERFLRLVEERHGILRSDIAQQGVYFSHETMTHASPSASCSSNEIFALRQCFSEADMRRLLICQTKGYTGHPMGVSFEEVVAVEVLRRGVVPPVVNFEQQDDQLGPLNLSKGGSYAAKYALRFAAGFGSQVAFALYSK